MIVLIGIHADPTVGSRASGLPVRADRAAKISSTRHTRLRRAARLGTWAYLLWCTWALLVQVRGLRGRHSLTRSFSRPPGATRVRAHKSGNCASTSSRAHHRACQEARDLVTWQQRDAVLARRSGRDVLAPHHLRADGQELCGNDAAARTIVDVPGHDALLTYHAAITLQRCVKGGKTVNVVELCARR